MRSKPSEITHGRRGERGAALVMSLLVAMLLLAAGGALIATAGMTVSNAVDSTAEVQAYYAADAGLQAAVTVIRRNRAGTGNLAANFHNFACGTANACTNDGDNLTAWLPYTNGQVTLSASPTLSYSVRVSDPGLSGTANIAANYTPRFLTIESVGRGPQGAVKQMRLIVDRFYFDFTPKSTLLMRGAENCADMAQFSIGQSNAKEYSGNDAGTPAQPALPVFGTTCGGNATQATDTVNGSKPNTVTSNPQGKVAQLTNSDLPEWLQDANAARALLLDLAAKASGMGRYFKDAQPGDFGTSANPKLTFCDGDCDLSNGAGLLVVTGTLTMKGNASFDGLILVLGEGAMTRNGGGNGDIMGALVVAKFARTWPASENNQPHPFLAPTFDTNGGGNSTVQYNSTNVNNAMNSLGNRVLGVQEL